MISFKVGAKGGVSVYGLQRFPVTLYVEQWEALVDAMPDLLGFIDANRGTLKRLDRGEPVSPPLTNPGSALDRGHQLADAGREVVEQMNRSRYLWQHYRRRSHVSFEL